MKIKNKKNKFNLKLIHIFIALFAIFIFFSLLSTENIISADSIEDLQTDDNDETQKKLEELEEKAKVYREIIETKQKQQATLNNQLSIMNSDIYKVETEIESTKEKIDNLNNKIQRTGYEIEEMEKKIDQQKKLLGDLLNSYFEVTQRSLLGRLINFEALAPFMSEKDKFIQTSEKMQDVLNSVKAIKTDLELEKNELEGDKEDVIDLKIELEEKNAYLEKTRQQKQQLLSETAGEESKYQEKLERVEKQKLELLNLDALASSSGLSAANYDKPPSKYHSSLDWFYFQQDSRWGDNKIGNSNSLMKDYGCAVAAVAMVFTHHNDYITPKNLAKQPIFYWDLIAWPSNSIPDGEVNMSSAGSYHGNIDWDDIDDEIDDGNPVIVYIKKTNGGGGHYVVIHGYDKDEKEYVVHDPYFGPNIYLSTSRSLVGLLPPSSGTNMDQMIIYK